MTNIPVEEAGLQPTCLLWLGVPLWLAFGIDLAPGKHSIARILWLPFLNNETALHLCILSCALFCFALSMVWIWKICQVPKYLREMWSIVSEGISFSSDAGIQSLFHGTL